MNYIADCLARMILVSIPEQAFISLLALRFLKSYNLFKTDKNKFFLVILPAFLSNLPRIAGVDENISMMAGIITTILVVWFVAKRFIILKAKTVLISVGQAALAVTGSFAIFMITELFFATAVSYATHLTYPELSDTALHSFLATMPERIAQYIFLYVLLFRKLKSLKNNTDIDVIQVIRDCKVYRKYAMIVVAFYIIYMVILSKALLMDKLLFNLNPTYALFLVILLFFPPIMAGVFFIELVYRSHFNTISYVNIYTEEIKARAEKAKQIAEQEKNMSAVKAINIIIEVLEIKE